MAVNECSSSSSLLAGFACDVVISKPVSSYCQYESITRVLRHRVMAERRLDLSQCTEPTDMLYRFLCLLD